MFKLIEHKWGPVILSKVLSWGGFWNTVFIAIGFWPPRGLKNHTPKLHPEIIYLSTKIGKQSLLQKIPKTIIILQYFGRQDIKGADGGCGVLWPVFEV